MSPNLSKLRNIEIARNRGQLRMAIGQVKAALTPQSLPMSSAVAQVT